MSGKENSVANAKLDDYTDSCTVKDVQRMGVTTTYWSVDDSGEPVDYLDSTDSDFYEEQFNCTKCLDYFNSWDEAREHFEQGDYAHCEGCDKIINKDTETFVVYEDDTYCAQCALKEKL